MSLTYVHLSDIHFGQEKGSDLPVHADVKECLLADLAAVKVEAGLDRMAGVIVTGDVAFSGKKHEYDQAARWLDQLTQVIGCNKTDVLVVPGNHDIDRDQITRPAEAMRSHLVERGSNELELFLADRKFREILYQKFHDYRAFAAGYDCPLESDGGVAVTRQVDLAPGHALRFVGLNSALLCTGHDGDEGKLLIGARQHVLPRPQGAELVVLCHHPLKYLQDREPAALYIRSRARVHIFGHMHRPFAEVEPIQGLDLLTISAGAAVPPGAEDGYQYTYNVISFEWDTNTEGLEVQIVPRTWNEEETRFDADTSQFAAGRFRTVLRGPGSRNRPSADPVGGTSRAAGTVRLPTAPTAAVSSEGAKRSAMASNSELLRLSFFRDLSAVQRLHVLMEVGILPTGWSLELTHTFERRLFDQALCAGHEDGLASAIHALLPDRETADRGEEL